MNEPPDGIIVTIGAKMIGENGYRHWLRNFLEAMEKSVACDSWFYWLRQGNQPRHDDIIRHVYLCIGGKIRFRCIYAGCEGERTMVFDKRSIHGKAWIIMGGPVERPPMVIKRKGFQGFRYTQQLW